MRAGAASQGRRGITLVEVVVSIVLLSMGLTFTARLLWEARRSLDRSEVVLRATLLLGELARNDGAAPDSLQRSSRTGRLSGTRYPDGRIQVVLDSAAEPEGERDRGGHVDGSSVWRIDPDAWSGNQ